MIREKLKEVGVSDESVVEAVLGLGVENLADFAELSRSDLIAVGLNAVQANKLIKSGGEPSYAVAVNVGVDSVLPNIPDDNSWLEALKIGGVLKPDQSTVIAAIRATLAEKAGLFAIPTKLLTEMERFADENDEPVDPIFFKVREQLVRRTYADIFEALPGLDGSFITEARKQKLFGRMRTALWPTVIASHTQLKNWQDTWMQGAANPAVVMMAMAGGTMSAGLIAPPDTGVLRDCGEDIRKAVNAAFKGTGSQVASALAYDASQIHKILENPNLPQLLGTQTREQMLKILGISVTANYVRQEQNIVKYVLSFLQAQEISAEGETAYFSALAMLGNQIDWGAIDKPLQVPVL